ncbi:MAG: hypothetical protein HFF75_01135 [Oscillospiraceae bacterium]|nr:hypothetical protein [Oscillospiraceae bacterium]
MYKKTVRGISLLFAILMIMSTSTFAMDTRASSRIAASSARVKMGIDSNLWVYFSVNAVSIMDDIGASKITIQRYSGSRWITESTFTPEDVPEMQTSNELWHSATIPYSPKYSGYSYRAVVAIYATDSSGTSTTTVTSTSVTT